MRVRENITDSTILSVQSAHNVAAFIHSIRRTVFTKITESLFVMFSQFNYSTKTLKSTYIIQTPANHPEMGQNHFHQNHQNRLP